ncbi:MAG: hypothetical protein K2P84_06380 [Undibacterium sp.]|nr:hypothetical protein [Undibacterium sp.]
MLWILGSCFFFWLIFRELISRKIAARGFDHPDPTPISKLYLAILLAIALLCAWTPYRYWRFERFLTSKANLLTAPQRTTVHCNTVFDTFFDREYFAAGHANFETGEIVFQHPWCGTLMDYLNHPENADPKELFSVVMFAHESMHVRGEHDEAKTECQAVQRSYRTAKILGVPDHIAKQNALNYYHNFYLNRGKMGQMQEAYFSEQCAPGKALDEHLSDSTWAVD